MLNQKVESIFAIRRGFVPRRPCELVALIAISSTFFLLLHTNNLHYRLRQMETRAQSDELSPASSSGAFSVAGGSGFSAGTGGVNYYNRLQESNYYNTQQLNNTRKAQKELLFFNRVPKVGSQTFMELLRLLAQKNEFGFYRDQVQKVETIRLLPSEQLSLAALIGNYDTPGVFVKHVCFLNFTQFSFAEPIYMNVVRDPIERVISWYYYVRAPWYYVERKRAFPDLPLPDVYWLKKDYETCVLSHDPECQYNEGATREGIGDHRRQTMFFCGHEEECTPFNSPGAMEKAMRAVEENYAVVGVLEDLNATLTVLENYIPRFFKGASDIYYTQMERFRQINRNIYKPTVREEVKDVVRRNFTREIEFYQFCRQRLYRQFSALRLPNQNYY